MQESSHDVSPRPVLVHYVSTPDLVEAAYITAEGVVETSRASGSTYDAAVYMVGEHFGTWALLTQKDNAENVGIWYEEGVEVSAAHLRILERIQ